MIFPFEMKEIKGISFEDLSTVKKREKKANDGKDCETLDPKSTLLERKQSLFATCC